MNAMSQAAINSAETSVQSDMIEYIPPLRAYARALTRNMHDADDLVQETLLKALSKIDTFQRGTMLRAWLFTIMRNSFFTNVKKRAREQPGAEDCVSGLLSVQPDHDMVIHGKRLLAAIERLPEHYREILVLVLMLGETYEDAAVICNVAVGTVKSRVNRARKLVMDEMGADALLDLVEH